MNSLYLKFEIYYKDLSTQSESFLVLYSNNYNGNLNLVSDIRGLGGEYKDNILSEITGSINIDNSPNSLGFQKKFSDLVLTKKFIDEKIRITIEQDINGSVTSWTSTVGIVKRLRISGNIVTLDVGMSSLTQRRFLGTYDQSNATALQKDTVQTAPVIFGSNQQVQAQIVQFSDGTNYWWNYAFGTIFRYKNVSNLTRYLYPTITKYYAQDAGVSEEYIEVVSASSHTSPFAGNIAGTSNATPINQNYHKKIIDYTPDAGKNGICYRAVIPFYDEAPSFSPLTGGFKLEVYPALSNGMPDESNLIAKSEILKSQVGFTGGGTLREVGFVFNKPFPLVVDRKYAFVLTMDENTGSGEPSKRPGENAGSAYVQYFLPYGLDNYYTGYQHQIFLKLYCAIINYDSAPSTRIINSLTIEEDAALIKYYDIEYYQNGSAAYGLNADSTAAKTDGTKLKMIVECEGMKDTGTDFAAVADTVITNPREVLKCLIGTVNSGGYLSRTTNSVSISSTCLSSTSHEFYRKAAFTLDKEINIYQLINKIADEMGLFITYNNKQPYIRAWGDSLDRVFNFNDTNSSINAIIIKEPSSVINQVKFKYYKNFTQKQINDAIFKGTTAEYLYELAQDCTDYTGIETSIDLYGAKYPQLKELEYINDLQSVTVLSKYFLYNYFEPGVFISLDVPYEVIKETDLSTDIGSLNKVGLSFPELPNYQGTSANPFPSQDDGDANIWSGALQTRAKYYTGVTYGMFLNYNQKGLYYTVIVKLLNNALDPT